MNGTAPTASYAATKVIAPTLHFFRKSSRKRGPAAARRSIGCGRSTSPRRLGLEPWGCRVPPAPPARRLFIATGWADRKFPGDCRGSWRRARIHGSGRSRLPRCKLHGRCRRSIRVGGGGRSRPGPTSAARRVLQPPFEGRDKCPGLADFCVQVEALVGVTGPILTTISRPLALAAHRPSSICPAF